MTEPDAANIARLGFVLSAETRAGILCALLGGTAHTQTELARHLGCAASSISEHVAVLLDHGLVTVEAQGRRRYLRLANAEWAELLERLGATGTPVTLPRVRHELAFARSCYGHLAGELAVRLFESSLDDGRLEHRDDALRVTSAGNEWLRTLGLTAAGGVRPCLDWSHRRNHLAGGLGRALLGRTVEAGWLRRHPSALRVLQLTEVGRRELPAALRMELP